MISCGWCTQFLIQYLMKSSQILKHQPLYQSSHLLHLQDKNDDNDNDDDDDDDDDDDVDLSKYDLTASDDEIDKKK